MSERKINATRGNMAKVVLQVLFPILISGLFQQLYNTADGMIIGQGIGSDAMAIAGGAPATFVGLFNGFTLGISTGAMILVSHCFGSNQFDQLKSIIKNALVLSFILAILAVFLVHFGIEHLFIFLNVPNTILQESVSYIKIVSFGFIPNLVVICAINILRAMGETKRPLYTQSGMFILNIVLDIILVIFFKLQLTGVALAYVLTQLTGLAVIYIMFTHKESDIGLDFKTLKLDPTLIGRLLKIGLPLAFSSLLYSMTNLVLLSSVNKLGTDSISAWAICGKIDSVFWILMTGFGVTASTVIGQNLGAKQFKRAKEGVKYCLIYAYISGGILCLCYYLFAPQLVSIFTNNNATLVLGVSMLRFMAPAYLIYVDTEIISADIKGHGNTLVPTLITLLSICVVRISWILLYVEKYPSLLHTAAAYPLSWIASSILFIAYYIYFNRTSKQK